MEGIENEESHRLAQGLERCMAKGDGRGIHEIFDLLVMKGHPGAREVYVGPFVPVRKGDALKAVLELRQAPVGKVVRNEAHALSVMWNPILSSLQEWFGNGGLPVVLEVAVRPLPKGKRQEVVRTEKEAEGEVSMMVGYEEAVQALQVEMARRVETYER